MESPPGATAVIDGREVDYFCGCGYFCLQGHPDLIDSACQAVRQFGIGSATNRSGYGNHPVLLEVERNAAAFFAKETAFYYASGYLGNTLLLQGLREDYDVIFYDADSHDSVLDGIALAESRAFAFAHRDADDLKMQVERHLKPSERPLVISDGVFPVSGELPPMDDYLEVLQPYDKPTICVDDAHAIGVIGEQGRGSFEYLGVSGPRLYSSGTLSKAFGAHGGIIAGSSQLIERLISKSRIPSATSPPATPVAAASAKALEVLHQTPGLRSRLWDNARYAKNRFRALGFNVNDTPVPIICLSSTNVDLTTLPSRLLDKRIAVAPFFADQGAYSSVPAGGAVRIAIFSSHTRHQIDRLVDEIGARV